MSLSMPDPADPTSDYVAAVDAAWGDPETWIAEGLQWGHLDQIRRTINQRVTGDPELPAINWFFQQVAPHRPLPLDRVLVIGCGASGLETRLVQSGMVASAVALDLSPRALALAAQAAAAAGLTSVVHRQADMNALPLGTPDLQPGSFDAVFAVAGIHHCANLEGLYATVAQLLVPGGWFFLDEFIGPNRFQWSDLQLGLVNGVLSTLPDALVKTGTGQLRRGYVRPTVDNVLDVDPSEAVRSADIVPLLPRWFTIECQRGYGGNLLHLILSQIAQNFHNDPGGYLTRMIALEDWCLSQGMLTDDFAVILARKQP